MPSYAKFYKALMTARIPDGAKIVFCALLDFQQMGLLNPKIETLAKAVGKGWKAVQHDLRWLRKSGLIQVTWGQRQSRYQIPENWQILLGQIRASEPNPVRPNPSITLGQIRASEPAPPYYFQDSFIRPIEKESSREKPRKLSTRGEKAAPPPPPVLDVVPAPAPPPDLAAVLAECREIYRRAGVPVPAKHEQVALQLLVSLEDGPRSRVAARLPDYLKWALATGRWDSPAHTKSLLNVLRDGDWDVELVLRDLPEPPRKQNIIEQKTQEYLRRHAKGAS